MKVSKSIMSKLIVAVIMVIMPTVFVTKPVEASWWGDIINFGEIFLEEGASESLKDSNVSDAETAEIMSILYNSLLTLGVIITVAMGGVLGVKFMTSSAEDKAKVKESMVPYVIGSAVIFGAFIIWKICINIFSQIS